MYFPRHNDPEDFAFDQLWERVDDLVVPYMVSFSVETNTKITDVEFPSSLPVRMVASCNDLNTPYDSGLIEVGPVLVGYRHLHNSSRVWCRLATGEVDKDKLDQVQQIITESLPPIKQTDDKVRVKFWNWASHGPSYNIRHLDAPKWEDIRENYASSARDDLDSFVHLKPADITSGRLAILHGPPGTGKTTLIRALCREWKNWCSIDYIIDPEAFFGNAMYMTSTLMATPEPINTTGAYGSPPYFDMDDPDDAYVASIFNAADGTKKEEDPWRLLIIEDAEEFVTPQAKAHTGQALSRLLNVGDGFIGQGLNILILLTTNAHLDDVHEAVKRPGRCMANIEVPIMGATEATKWLGAPTKSATLAELFEQQKTAGQIGNGVKQIEGTGQYL